jgi:hypothetical protein
LTSALTSGLRGRIGTLFRNYSNVHSGKFFTTEAPDFAKALTRQAEDTELAFLFAHRETTIGKKNLHLR